MSCTLLAHPLSSVATVLHFIIEITVLLLKKKKTKQSKRTKKKNNAQLVNISDMYKKGGNKIVGERCTKTYSQLLTPLRENLIVQT